MHETFDRFVRYLAYLPDNGWPLQVGEERKVGGCNFMLYLVIESIYLVLSRVFRLNAMRKATGSGSFCLFLFPKLLE